jgi:hypothetical protein
VNYRLFANGLQKGSLRLNTLVKKSGLALGLAEKEITKSDSNLRTFQQRAKAVGSAMITSDFQ